MVRLKETVRTWFREIKKFQFHYGTIKSRPFSTHRRRHVTFQFHYGTIKRNQQVRQYRYRTISIPLWYD